MAVFAKVVESSSFAAAARHFDMSPAMVSKHIRTLEERLGVRLLNRTTRRVSATEVGQNYYERCLRILNELEDAERAAGDLEAAPRGLLRVTSSVSFGAHQLAPAIADYLVAYPDVSIDLSLHDNYVDLLEERIDLGDPPRPAVGFEPDRQKIICGRNGAVRLPGLSGGARHAAKAA